MNIENKTVFIVEFNGVVEAKIVNQFYKDMEAVKKQQSKGDGIIVRMSCPGGSPALSEEVMQYLQQAGACVGVGDWRRQKSGDKGGFEIVDLGDERETI